MAEELVLEAQKRDVFGKKLNNERKKGLLPSVLYGHGIKNIPLFLNYRDFEKIFQKAGENTIVKLVLKGEEKSGAEHNALVYEVGRDLRTNSINHVDFYQIRMDEAVKVSVPLNFVGTSEAVVRDSGILVKAMQEIEVEALPANLPHEIEVDISKLATLESTIYVKDLELPKGVKITVAPETPVATVEPPRSEEELKELETAPAAEAVAEIKTEGEEKRAAKEAEKVEEEKAAEGGGAATK